MELLLLMLELKFKKLSENAKIPTKAHETDACYDVYSPVDVMLRPKEVTKFPLDFAVQCPDGYKLCFYSRSGVASRGILLSNSVGIIDQDYRGCCAAALYNSSNDEYYIRKGDRILQCALEKVIPFNIVEVEELSETERGAGGFGSSGK
jgi:dUTP pyrophosphatase